MKTCPAFCIHTIFNLTLPNRQQLFDKQAVSGITKLIRKNILANSTTNTYDEQANNHLISNKTAQTIYAGLKKGFRVYFNLTTNDSRIAGCGVLIKYKDRYFTKSLHVHSDFRERDPALQMCSIRENLLRRMGVHEVYTNPLLFPATISFHKKRGFTETKPFRPRYFSILMKKTINYKGSHQKVL